VLQYMCEGPITIQRRRVVEIVPAFIELLASDGELDDPGYRRVEEDEE